MIRIQARKYVLFGALFMSATIGAPRAARASAQVSEYDGCVCRLLDVSAQAGYTSAPDLTGNLIHANNHTGTFSFVCPAVLSSTVSNYAVQGVGFGIDIRTNPGGATPSLNCAGTVESPTDFQYGIQGFGPDNSTYPVSRVYWICSVTTTTPTDFYLRSYKITASYVQQ